MKPTSLRRGDKIICDGITHPLTFQTRVPSTAYQTAKNIFIVEAWETEANDTGESFVTLSDYEVIHRCKRAHLIGGDGQ